MGRLLRKSHFKEIARGERGGDIEERGLQELL